MPMINPSTRREVTLTVARAQRRAATLERNAEAALGRTRRRVAKIAEQQQRAAAELVDDARAVGAQAERRAESVARALAEQVTALLTPLGRTVEGWAKLGLQQLDVASREDVHRLSHRLGRLERRIPKQGRTTSRARARRRASESETVAAQAG